MTAAKLKRELEYVGRVYEWHPTGMQLREIAERIVSCGALDHSKLHEIISEECPGTISGIFEGLDNSDLRTLIALAIALTKEGA